MEVFPKRKELADAQTAFRSSRKNLHFSSRSSTKCRSLFRLVGINFASLVFGLICFCGCIHPLQRVKQCCVKNLRPHFLSVKWRGRYGALKKKSCLSEASSFLLAECPTGVAQKVQTAVFLFCYLFLSAARKKKVRITHTKITPHQYNHKAAYKTHVS